MKKIGLVILIFFILQIADAQVATYKIQHAEISFYKLQAMYIYNFAKYMKWRTEISTFVIGVFGNKEVLTVLQQNMQDKKANGKYIEAREIKTLDEIEHCQIIYLPKSKSKQLPGVIQLYEYKEILIVTEEDLSMKGAAISFFTENGNVKFKINQQALAKTGLIASSGLLAIGVIVGPN